MRLFLKNLLFTVLVPGTVAVFLPYWMVAHSGQALTVDPVRLLLAGPLMLLGATIYFWCLWDFAVTGRGTPAPIDPPKHLVVRGLYRYVRNPMYVGVLLVIAGWAALSASRAVLGYGAVIAVSFHLFVVVVEEPLLRRQFGEAYETYCRTVSRWVPGSEHAHRAMKR
jgi:protein-S-isoprenylcysteine O-methyltransferase Ste14